jgi:hypothetical protein
MIVREGVLIDGWDSSLGTYVEQLEPGALPAHVESSGQLVGSNGAVALVGALLKPTRVYGDVTAGPELTVQTRGSVTVAGEKASADNPVDLPAVELPEVEPAAGLALSGAEPFVVPSGEAAYEHLHVASGSELVLTGPLRLVLGELEVATGGTLSFDTRNGEVELVVESALDLAAGSKVTSTEKDPTRIAIRVAAEQGEAADPLVKLAALGAFYGTVYAPAADVAISSPFEVFGWVTAGGLDLGQNVRVHVDRALSTTNENGVTQTRYGGWRIVDLSQIASAARSRDPFAALGLDPTTLQTPAEAQDQTDVHVKVEYQLIRGGPVLTYSGLETGLDFSLLFNVVSITRYVVR